ncbi:SRPBCC family protein [Sphingomonas naphthae]|uniref:SRPBCC family protein n=1 Tax=Sphingomonas naphthae TaxID=1813468 RepID=A0ABY7TNC4_9SPHN|nr:SRPBCC family protein [Sphingomonas naphthae]WCT73359.1 SRPBCC family protein [Sphingomonas naphthae]
MSDETFDLSISRIIDAPVAAVWRAYTEHTEEWFCPKPWRVEIVEWDLRPGGRSALVMHGPDGEVMPMEGVFLEIVPESLIVTTDAFRTGWVPQTAFMTAITEFIPQGDKTAYRATARHWTEEARAQHEAMGFETGWGTVAGQLEEVAKRLAAG